MTLSQSDNFNVEKPITVSQQQSDDSTQMRASDDYSQGSVEFSEPLETSETLESEVSLEEPIMRYVTVPSLSTPQASTSVPVKDARSQSVFPSVPQTVIPEPLANQADEMKVNEGSTSVSPSVPQPVAQTVVPEPVANRPQQDEIVISLWDERLKINRRKRKTGEVVVRKEIETHIIEVPVRREKLIVEQVSPNYQQIAVLELGQAEIIEPDNFEAVTVNALPTVRGEFVSASAAIQFLNAIADESDSELQKVQIQIVLEDAALQPTYQNLIDQYSSKVIS